MKLLHQYRGSRSIKRLWSFLPYLVLLGSFSVPIHAEVWHKKSGGGADEVITNAVLNKYPASDNWFYILQTKDDNQSEYVVELDGRAGRIFTMPAELNSSLVFKNDADEVISLPLLNSNDAGYDIAGIDGTLTVTKDETVDGYIVLLHDSPIRIKVELSSSDLLLGSRVSIRANLFRFEGTDDEDESIESMDTAPVASTDIKKILAQIVTPSGLKRKILLSDNGQSGDMLRNDDIFGSNYVTTESGLHKVEIVWESNLEEGEKVRLTGSAQFYVSPDVAVIARSSVQATEEVILGETLEADRYGLPVKINSVRGDVPTFLHAKAEIWSDNKTKPVGWIGGIIEPQKQTGNTWVLPLTFHSGWLTEGDYKEPFHIRNVSLIDEESGSDLLRSSTDVRIRNLPQNLGRKSAKISEDDPVWEAMRNGVSPQAIVTGQTVTPNRRTAQRIVDVAEWRRRNPVVFLHGYCTSGTDTWLGAPVYTNFSNRREALLYEGTQKGASAQTYAREVSEWVSQRIQSNQIDGIRGVVGHSHGGLAAVTLFDRYGGLFTDHPDYDPDYRIISVGSPYYGATAYGRLNVVFAGLPYLFKLGGDCLSVPYDLDPYRNHSWRGTISSNSKRNTFAWYTSHGKDKNWLDTRSCSKLSKTLLVGGYDDGLIMRKDARGFVDDDHRYDWCHAGSSDFNSAYGVQVNLPDLTNMAHAQFDEIGNSATNYCSSDRVDSDGDGWGWERGQSCTVWTGVLWCSSSRSDSDGDGWGWENGQSCRVR